MPTFNSLKAEFPNYLTDDDQDKSAIELLYCIASRQQDELAYVRKALDILPDSVAISIMDYADDNEVGDDEMDTIETCAFCGTPDQCAENNYCTRYGSPLEHHK